MIMIIAIGENVVSIPKYLNKARTITPIEMVKKRIRTRVKEKLFIGFY